MNECYYSDLDISGAIDQVQSHFPFENYITIGQRRELESLIPLIAKHMNISPSTEPHLLDIGCGPMDKTAIFATLGFQCFAVDDLSDPWHEIKNNKHLIHQFAEKFNIRFHQQDQGDYSIPFKTKFDVVTLFAVIEHLHESPRELLKTAGEFLHSDGLLAVTMPNSVNLRKRIAVCLGKTNYPPVEEFYYNRGTWRGHVREYTLDETKWIVRAGGFEILEAGTLEGMAYDKLDGVSLELFLKLSKLMPSLRSILYVIAKKPKEWLPYADPE